MAIIVVSSRLDSRDSEQLSVTRFCEYGNEPSCSTEDRQFLEQMRDHYFTATEIKIFLSSPGAGLASTVQ
jgi:hypothetical protein